MLAAGALFFLLFVYVGGHGNYFGIWLRDEAGWSEAAIGWQGGIHYACLIAFPLWWGFQIDRSGDPGRVLRFIATAAAITFVPFVLTSHVGVLLAVTLAFGAFRVGMVTSTDALTLAHVERSGGDYGRVRIWGSLGFIAGGFVLAAVVAQVGRSAIPGALLAILVLTAVLTTTLPGRLTSTPQRDDSLLDGLKRLLRRPELRRFLAISFGTRLFAQGLYVFLPLHLKDLGVADEAVPIYWAIGVVSEIALMGNARRLFGRFSMRRVITLCLGMATLQFALLGAIDDPTWLYPVMLLHGMSFGIWYYASVTWLGAAVPSTDRARVQGLFQSISFGAGGTLSAIACGYLFDLASGSAMFVAAAAGMALMTLLAARALP